MRNYLFFYIIICFCHLNAFAQGKNFNDMPQYKGYEHSLTNEIISKMPKKNQIKKQQLLELQNNLNRNSETDYEYFDVVRSSINIPLAQCHDDNGNTFVTGSSGNATNHSGDITTIKMDQNGTIVWTAKIPSSTFTVNSGTHLTLDNQGNIILVGYIWSNDSTHIICAKISNDGEIIWQSILNNDTNFEVPTAIFVNPTNEIFITGITHSDNQVTYFTSKVDALGQLVWEHVEPGFSAATWNEPKAISQDSSGNIIVVGYGYDQSERSAVVTIKYNDNGQLLWKKIKPYEVALQDLTVVPTDAIPHDFVIDSQNNIYITGTFKTEFASSSTIFGYDENGAEIWNLDHQEPEETTNTYTILLHQNVLYVGGIHSGNSTDGYLLMSININGTTNWIETTQDLIWPNKFKMYESNDAIILNSVAYTDLQVTNSKINTTSFSTAGDQTSSSNFAFNNEALGLSFGYHFDSFAHNNNSVFSISSNYSDIGNVFEVIKLDTSNPTASLVWDAKFQEINATSTNVIETVSDSNSNVYSVVSSFYVVDNQINQKSYLIKYNNLGEIVWNNLIDNTPNVVSLRLKTDRDNNAIVLLGKPLNDTTTEVTMKKLSPDGNEIWSTTQSLDLSGNLFLEITNSNNILIIGSAMSDGNTTKIIVGKISESGTVLFTNQYQPSNIIYTNNFANKAIVDENDNVIIGGGSGSFNSTTFRFEFSPSILKIDTNGILDYFNVYAIPNHSSYIVDIDKNTNGFTAAIDASDLTASNNKIQLMGLNNSGDLIWENSFQELNANCFVYKLLKGIEDDTLYTVGTRLGDEQNIQIVKWNLNQNTTTSTLLNNLNYYNDSYIDAQNIYILSQNQESLHFPRRILNWSGPYISAKITKLNYNLEQNESINLIGENYALYEPKQFIPLHNNNLLVSGKLFDEQFFFEGLDFFSTTINPILSIPNHGEPATLETFLNYPNPIDYAETNVLFELEQQQPVTLNLYDANGRFIKKLLSGIYNPGRNNVNLKLPILMKGVYVLELVKESSRIHTKLLINN